MIETTKEITDIDAPEIDFYRTLRRPQYHREQGIFVAEGDKVVERLFESRLEVVSVLLVPEILDQYAVLLDSKKENIKVFLTDAALMKNIVGYRYHQGIMAVGKIPKPQTLTDILSRLSTPALLVALDRIESAENTGIIVRNCAANGVHALIIGETSTDPYLRRAVRNSMGTLFNLPILYTGDLSETLRMLHSIYDCQIIAAHPRPDSSPVSNINFCNNSCIVLGNEGTGLCPQILKECNHSALIPMVPNIDSLNVACASAVILYEATKQRADITHYKNRDISPVLLPAA